MSRQLYTSIGAVALVIANIVAVKITAVTVPFVGTVSASVGVFPIAITFLCTDIISEQYGKREARRSVMAIIGTLVLGWLLLQLAVFVPHNGGVPDTAFNTVLGASTPLVIASVTTATLSQTVDVELFHRIKLWKQKRWYRNIGSTCVSQLLDTTVFTLLAFVLLPNLIGGITLPLHVVVSVIATEYLVKVVLAIVDTPIFYAVTENENGV